jgi:WD40 repeat protein
MVRGLSFSPDGKMLVSGGGGSNNQSDTRVRAWDVESGTELWTSFHNDMVWEIAFASNSDYVFSGSRDATVKVWDAASGEIVNTFFDTQPVTALAISSDGLLLASGSWAKTATVWNIATGEKLYTLHHSETVYSLAFSTDGNFLAGGSDNGIKTWSLSNGEELSTFGEAGFRSFLTFLPGEELLLSNVANGDLKIWNPINGDLVEDWPIGFYGVLSAAFSPDGKEIATGLYQDVTTKLWDVDNGQLLNELSENFHGTNCDGVNQIAFDPDGTRFITASACNNSKVSLWQRESEAPITLDTYNKGRVVFSPDGHLAVWVRYRDGADDILVWDADTNSELRAWRPGNNGQYINDLAFSPNGAMLAVAIAGDGKVQLWDIESEKLIRVYTDHEDVRDVTFSHDGNLIAAAVGDHGIKIWEVESGLLLKTLRGDDSWANDAVAIYVNVGLTFSPAGDMLVAGGSAVTFWSLESGELLLRVPMAAQTVFSPDGRLLLLSGYEGSVQLWGVLP